MGRPKKPVEDRPRLEYPRTDEAAIHRRRFMAILGGGTAGAALLATGCVRTAGKPIAPSPVDTDAVGPEPGGTAPPLPNEPCDLPDTPEGPPARPPGMPPRPAEGEVARIPAQGIFVATGDPKTEISYAVWVEYEEADDEAMRALVTGDTGDLERSFSRIVSRLHAKETLETPDGNRRASAAIQDILEKAYERANGTKPKINRLWIEISRTSEKTPIPGGVTAPVRTDPEPPPRPPGVPPRPKGKAAPRPPMATPPPRKGIR